jgi:hypothetical protein
VSTSLNLGKEGPMVHLAACATDVWLQLFPRLRSNEGAVHFHTGRGAHMHIDEQAERGVRA